MATTPEIELLAAEIGENIYIEIAKWHLYLSDAHLHMTLAEKLYPFLEDDTLDENAIDKILAEVSVRVGGGKKTISLADLLPNNSQNTLIDLLEEFKQKM